ncbi:MAG: DNA polymerase III subunit [Oscillospiraceae bacterium]|nr:DNA polymerase III subunit [Oscillospiraceae bacterium]
MAFESLLGNERIRQNLSAAAAKNRFSHFYLISGPKGSGKHTLAKLLASALMCENTPRPCGTCSACRKIMAGVHPDFITVEDPDHKNVAVRLIREARESMFIRPNEGSRKIYLFPQEMGIEGQNALLKILEEPPSYGVFIILSDNPEKLLTTVRSRCTELTLTAVAPELLKPWLAAQFPGAASDDLDAAIRRSGGYPGQAAQLLRSGEDWPAEVEAFVKSFAARDTMGLVSTLVPMEKWKRDQALPVFEAWLTVLQDALSCRSGVPASSRVARDLAAARSSKDLLQAIKSLQKAIEYTQGNVSVAAVCGWLTYALR